MEYTLRKISSHKRRAAAEQLAAFLLRRANHNVEQYLHSLMKEMFDPLNARAIQQLIRKVKQDDSVDKSMDIINQDMDKREQFLNKLDSLKSVITHPVLVQDMDDIKNQIFEGQLTLNEAEALLQAIHFKQSDFEDTQGGQNSIGEGPVNVRPEQPAKPAKPEVQQQFTPLWADEGAQ
jgi:hypothetical protein